MFEINFIFFVLVLALSIFSGVFVLLKNNKNKVNRTFFYLTLSICTWILSSYLEDEISNQRIISIFLKLDYAAGALILLYFFLFISEVTGLGIVRKLLFKIPAYSLTLILIYLIFFTGHIVNGYELLPGGLNPVLGDFEFLYEIFLAVFLIGGFVVAAFKYKKSSKEKQSQILYIFTGLTIFVVVAIITNVILVDFIKDSPDYTFYSRFGIYSVVFLNIFGGYAIIKHRLLNIKIIASELLALGVVVISLVQLFTAERLSNFIVQLVIFVIISFFAFRLIKSVDEEIKRKDELQIMADKLAVANDQLRKLDNAKTEFISIASHQLRTPLTSVKGFVSMIIEGSYGEISPAVKDALIKVYSSSERLIQLVEDLLNVSRIESGRLQFSFEKADLGAVLTEIYDNFMLVAKNKKMYLDLKAPKKLPMINMDSGKIREVVSNLVDNAFKYTPKGGVTIKAEVVDKKSVRVTISDTGIGVPKGETQNLFKKFSRGSDTARLHASGTGLGLYVGKEIINAHKGKIWLESDGEGKGSRFIIEIPINHSEE